MGAPDPHETLARLREGNARFVAGRTTARFDAERLAASVERQRPEAIVVGCSDSRVPVEAVFDAGVGELFVVRSAGHVLSDVGFASVRFALEKLGTRLVVVLGHEDCGAVKAALAREAPPWLAPVTRAIDLASAPASLAEAVDAHVLETVAEIRAWIGELAPAREPALVAGAAYELATGKVHWLGEDPSALG